MSDIITYIAQWWEKYLSKCNLIRHTCSWRDKLKPYIKFNTHKRTEAENNDDKKGKAFFKLTNNAAYGKIMQNLRNEVDIRLVNNEKYYLKQTSKLSSITQKISDNVLVAINKLKATFTLKKIANLGMCVLELSINL